MELHAEHPALLHGGGERAVVISGCDLAFSVARGVGVDEVESRAVRDSVEELECGGSATALAARGARLRRVGKRRQSRRTPYPIPTYLRNGQHSFEAAYGTADQAQAGRGPVLLRDIEKQLMADADTQQRCSVRDSLTNRAVDARLAQPGHGRGERAHSRQHQFRRGRDQERITRDLNFGIADSKRASDVRDVRDGGIDQRHHQMTPFVLGTSLPITSFAPRTATANALKIASAAWCPLRPRIRST